MRLLCCYCVRLHPSMDRFISTQEIVSSGGRCLTAEEQLKEFRTVIPQIPKTAKTVDELVASLMQSAKEHEIPILHYSSTEIVREGFNSLPTGRPTVVWCNHHEEELQCLLDEKSQ